MKKLSRIVAVFSVLLLSTVSLFATGTQEPETARTETETPRRGGVLNVGLHIPLVTLDWQSTVAHPLPHVMGHVFEGLSAFGKDFNAVPELADSWQASADGLVWTFNLRKGVLFHNGEEMTSADAKSSIERWQKVGPKGPSLKTDRIETPDKYTVKMYFKQPIGQTLLLLLGSDENKCVIMPKEVADSSPESGKLSAVVGTGPYRFVEYKEDQYVKLARFEQYVARNDAPNYQSGKKVAYPDEIIFWIVPEASTRVAGLESGDYDIITDIPDSEYDRLQKTKGVVPVKNGPGLLFYMMFNHQTGPTSNLYVRKAIQAALDIDEVVAAAVPNPAFRLTNPSFYPLESAYNTSVRSELYDQANLAKVKEYLDKAGYKGELITYQVIATSARNVRVGVAVVEQLKKAGINAVVRNYDVQTWVAKRRDPNSLMIYSSEGYWIDPSLYQPEFSGTFPSKEVGFKDPEVDAAFTALEQETDFQKRYKAGELLQTLFYDKVATINLGYGYRLVARRDYVMDPEANLALGNLTMHNVWLNK